MFFLILGAVVGFVVIAMCITIYNNLVGLNKQVDRSWANIETILKQRFDEIPQLVEVVEQYARTKRTHLSASSRRAVNTVRQII